MAAVAAAAPAAEPMLELRGLVSGYGKVKILDGVDMGVGKNTAVALLGGNGTGKSTILKAISGLLSPWEGQILFDGERIDSLRPDQIVRRGLVQVTQSKEAFPAMTVEDNLKIGAFVLADRRKTAEGLERAYGYFPALKSKRLQLAATLSGGQLQMLCIGRGLMSNPRMLMLDEPSAALAPQAVLDIFRNINRIRKDGMTVLVVEQNVRMALLLAEYGYVIRDGVIHLEGQARALIADDNVRLSYLGGTVAASA